MQLQTKQQKYSDKELRHVLLYRRAEIPQYLWFKKYQDNEKLRQAYQILDDDRWPVIMSRDIVDQFLFISEVLKNRLQQNPVFFDSASLLIRLAGKYTVWEEIKKLDRGVGLLGLAGIKQSAIYNQVLGDLIMFFGKALAGSASFVLGFQDVGDDRLLEAYGQDMIDFLSNDRFVFLKV